MTLMELALLAKTMRDAQKNYFRTRDLAALETSKRLERQLDDTVAAILNPPGPSLFDRE